MFLIFLKKIEKKALIGVARIKLVMVHRWPRRSGGVPSM
jgi:hypothetical protein